MNNLPSGKNLEHLFLETLRRILGEIGWLAEQGEVSRPPEPGPDISVCIRSSMGASMDLHVHVKREMTPGRFLSWVSKWQRESSKSAAPVLAVPVVSARLAEVCRRFHWSWLDLAGNCWIDLPGHVHVQRSGIPPFWRPRPRANLSTAAAARVMRVLLSPAHARSSWTQRSLQEHTCWRTRHDEKPVSLGLVNKVIRHLREQGYVDRNDRGFHVSDFEGLLSAWRNAYRFDRHQRRTFFTLLRGRELEETLHGVARDTGGMAVHAAFSAADRQAPHVRQPRTWVYVAAEFLDTLILRVRAKPAETGENLVALVPEDAGVFVSYVGDTFIGETGMGCTDPVQTYVDLCHCGGRGEEAAQALLEQRLLPAWKGART